MRTRQLLLAGILGLPLAALLPSSARADGFLSVYEDLPLAPGLTEVAGSGLTFDSPSGRIIEAYAEGKGSAEAVLHFYADTLPQLGWTRLADTRYRRDAEVLHLDPDRHGSTIVIHFTVSPE